MRNLNFGLIFIGIIIAIAVVYEVAYYSSGEQITITIKEKERITDGSESKYLVFADGETFQNTDMMFIGKFNSSDIEGKLEVGKSYRVKVYGWRFPLFSMYRNIGKFYGEEKPKSVGNN